jgi:hypothetical protein
MKRRVFLSLLLSPLLPKPESLVGSDFVWSKTEFNYMPHPAQLKFYDDHDVHMEIMATYLKSIPIPIGAFTKIGDPKCLETTKV